DEAGSERADPVEVFDRALAEEGHGELDLLAVPVDVHHHPGAVPLAELLRAQEALVGAGGDAEVVHPRPDPAAALARPAAEELLGAGEVVLELAGVVPEGRPALDLVVVARELRDPIALAA